ncbi:E3 ubiquitin-protein ligase lubel [Achroia grisella]|uniref:E3 ubiquitin-protein ligase lubel n=1 Tax=Achroia grisella TaxID=688607 RepID=UPI0027D21978|nr:E3 ubiquitin-protein ligase lubel [Achroia grisella]
MLKGRGRDPRTTFTIPGHNAPRPSTQGHTTMRPPTQGQAHLTLRQPVQNNRGSHTKPEPEYEVVEFPTEQYMNAKLQPPPPPPPRPPTGHPLEAGASCGLCGGGGARVRCAECGRRALCASCDDMYHRHPKRRNHQRQALSTSQLRDERPPLPPKGTPPVPPPRRHKMSGDRMSASPRPPAVDQRRATLGHLSMSPNQTATLPLNSNIHHSQQIPAHLQGKLSQPSPSHLGSMPYLAATPTIQHIPAVVNQIQSSTMDHHSSAWGRPRGSLPGVNMAPNMTMPTEVWENHETHNHPGQNWNRPLRRGASVLELGGSAAQCAGCSHCAPMPWRYGSCANLEHTWMGGWPPPPPACCVVHPPQHPHIHPYSPQTPQPYRRVDSRAASRAASRSGSRAASPAMSVRSRTSRRTKHRTPSPPPLPSSDADSESESDGAPAPTRVSVSAPAPSSHTHKVQSIKQQISQPTTQSQEKEEEESLGPAPPPPNVSWQCEHCTFVNEPGVRVCVICCRTPTAAPKTIEATTNSMARLKVQEKTSPSPARATEEKNGVEIKNLNKNDRTSTGCGPSPPREEKAANKPMSRLMTPTRDNTNGSIDSSNTTIIPGAGPSTFAAFQNTHENTGIVASPPRENPVIRASPYRETVSKQPEIQKHNVSVGPSPPRDNVSKRESLGPSSNSSNKSNHKKSAATSPPRSAVLESHSSSSSLRANVSNTGTSPPPQSISTQTYEVPNTSWERTPSVPRSRSRPRRRFRDDTRRERSHSRHSMSSDTRESERSVRTSGGGAGGGRWEWRETRDSSPGGEWSDTERRRNGTRLTRRASHLDLHRTRPARRSSFYGSEAASPEPLSSTRAISLEALVSAGARREAERGLELAKLMSEAERLGFSAAEVHAALAQSPTAPLAWLRERWPSLCAGVRAAAARLEPRAAVSELEARAALARHRGAMWPAVTDCVERHRRHMETGAVGEERRLRGHVWGSPVGVDDDAAPPIASRQHQRRQRAEDSSDEFEVPETTVFQDDDWMYLPLDQNINQYKNDKNFETWDKSFIETTNDKKEDIALKLKALLVQAGVPTINENLLLKGLLADSTIYNQNGTSNVSRNKLYSMDLSQSENDFIDAYNALTRLSPLPNVNRPGTIKDTQQNNIMQIANEFYENEYVLKNTENIKLEQIEDITFQSASPENYNHLQVAINTKQQEPENKLNEIFSSSEKANTEDETEKENKKTQIETMINQYNPERDSTEPKEHMNLPPVEVKTVPEKVITNSENIIKNTLENKSTLQRESPKSKKDINTPVTELFEIAQERNKNVIPLQTVSSNHHNITIDINTTTDNSIIHAQVGDFPHIIDNLDQNMGDLSNNVDIQENIKVQNVNESNSESISVQSNNASFGKKNIKLTTNKDFVKEEEDKSKNLNDIVDNTQKLIQQMKEEINSDIYSIEDANESQSEMETSSNESDYSSEHESSYSNTREETDNLTSDENVESSTNDEEDTEKRSIAINRTSSEDNEQFEEAMDHIQEQIEDFKYKNIEILDSISRSLQEEQTFAVELNDRKSPNEERQDQNNNMFTTVHSFEEIYDQLSTNEITSNSIKSNKLEKNVLVKNNNNIEKYDINISLYKPVSATKLILTEQRKSFLNAIEENIEEPLSIEYIDRKNNFNNKNSKEQILTNQSHRESTVSLDSHTTHSPKTETNDNISNIFVVPSDHPRSMSSGNESKDTNTFNDFSEPIDLNVSVNTSALGEIIGNDNSRNNSPEKKSNNQENDNNEIKNITASKSNIPKLIRILPKTKDEKSTPKVLVSKVPVRRNSGKQYPAPAPPKSHFGSIQSGFVKQLQTKLFNDKSAKTDTKIAKSELKVAVPSNLIKKKQAPLPPSKPIESVQPSPPKASPSKEKKKNYFRETCRTEDEWTESDPEDSQLQIAKPNEEPHRAPTPPPPITVRRVSGQIIDLARVRLPEGSPERQARMLLAEGAAENWEQAHLAVELVSRGVDPPTALLAALECIDLTSALTYLNQECELCASRLPEHEMVTMLRCTHRCCRECAKLYFNVQITERSIADCVCPYCKVPELETLPEDAWLEYFAHLDILLKTLLEPDIHELFQRKLRDRTLARDPNFKWCMECSSGFFVHPKQKKLRCPECRSVSCASCRKTWSSNHDGLTCDQYTKWLEDNDPEISISAVQQHLRENGLECPRCHFKYSLSRGGCMHFTCTQCKYEFCYGCGKPFTMGAQCGLSEYCAKLGLHSHHPRNCLFYLRDKEPHELQTLLQMNNVTYETEAPEGSTNRCPIQLQRETPTGLVDGVCGNDVPPLHGGLCKNHYLEYLSRIVRARGIDPLPLLGVDDLETLVRRAAQRLPPRPYGSLEGLYKRALHEIVREKIPLD